MRKLFFAKLTLIISLLFLASATRAMVMVPVTNEDGTITAGPPNREYLNRQAMWVKTQEELKRAPTLSMRWTWFKIDVKDYVMVARYIFTYEPGVVTVSVALIITTFGMMYYRRKLLLLTGARR